MVSKTDTDFGLWYFSYGYFGYNRVKTYTATTTFNFIFGTTTTDKICGRTVANKF